MATSNEQTYSLYIGSADIPPWPACSLSDESPGIYVEIRVEESGVQSTKAVKRITSPSWNEEFQFVGYLSSIISLSIKQSSPEPLTQDLCIGSMDVVLGVLLDRCIDDSFANLDVISETGEDDSSILAVKLSNLAYPDGLVSELFNLGISQQGRFERLGNMADLEDSIVSLKKAVALTDDGHPNKASHVSSLSNSQQYRSSVPVNNA